MKLAITVIKISVTFSTYIALSKKIAKKFFVQLESLNFKISSLFEFLHNML